LFRWLGTHFSDCTAYRFEPYTLRVTYAYRREDGEWKIVHRHADSVPATQGSPPASTVPP
jgi:ketosteroid isomerase-like protein